MEREKGARVVEVVDKRPRVIEVVRYMRRDREVG